MSVCLGCGLQLPASGQPPESRFHASAECWAVHGEIVGFELNHVVPLGMLHQLTVDAYGAQHPASTPRSPGVPTIRVAYSLVGLYLALEHGWNGLQVRDAHQRMGKPERSWPPFERPMTMGDITVLDVAAAGARADSVEGHADAVQRWAQSVWQAWSAQHADVVDLRRRVVGNPARRT